MSVKLLLSAIACDPFGGSEGIYGWNIVSTLATEFDCHVITHTSNRESLETAQARGMIPQGLAFRYHGKLAPYHENRLVARLQSWTRYQTFSRELLPLAIQWHKEVNFDVAQHLTYTTWRVASPLWRLGIPFIWGPISGTELFPRQCYSSLSLHSKLFELLRAAQSALAKRNPKIRECARHASAILVPHQQAKSYLSEFVKGSTTVDFCHNFIFPDARLKDLEQPVRSPQPKLPLTAFAAGNLEGRKGVAISLHALAMARDRGVKISYRVTSSGPELNHLKKLARKLALSDQVILGEQFPPGEYARALGKFDLCLLPSLRDGAGLSIMEAMLAGCVPIVADWCGPAEYVNSENGFKVEVTDPMTMARAISDILCNLDSDRARLCRLGNAAAASMRAGYNETQFRDFLSKTITKIIASTSELPADAVVPLFPISPQT
ncbi:MAG: glycosyltransferase family 4 protein [Verrucomicrobiota bacterium]